MGFVERAQGERLGEGRGNASGRLTAAGGEALEDSVAADDGALGVIDGIEPRRRLGKAGE